MFCRFPGLGAFGVVIDFGFFDVFGVKVGHDAERVIQIAHLANCIFKAADLNQLFHPSGSCLFENGEERLLGHI